MHTSQLLFAIFLMVLTPSKLEAGYKMYLKIDGIIGESTDPGHEGWIDVLAYNHGLIQPHSTSTRGGVERVDFQDFTVVAKVSKASPLIWRNGVTGKNFQKVKFECVCDDAIPKLKFTYEFETIVIRSVNNSYSPPPLIPPATYTNYGLTEQINFSFAKINWKFSSYDANGVPTNKLAYWDLLTNTGG